MAAFGFCDETHTFGADPFHCAFHESIFSF